MAEIKKKNFDAPDEQHESEKEDLDVIVVGGFVLRRLTYQPGWRWSTDVKPAVKTDTCQMQHFNILIAGRFHVQMADGSETECGPGDVILIPPGHDAWVVGDEPVVIIEQIAMGE